MLLESLANRLCSLQCDMMCEDDFELDSVNFTFMLWDHTARGVKMGCVGDGGELAFVMRYDSQHNGKRLFIGTPWLADALHHEQGRVLASEDAVRAFLHCVSSSRCLQTNVVFDGSLTVDEPISLHLQLEHLMDGKTLLVKDVAECGNVLLVIDMFE
jgi:hypothetical protein